MNVKTAFAVALIAGPILCAPALHAATAEEADFMAIRQAFENKLFKDAGQSAALFLEKYGRNRFRNEVRLILGQCHLNLQEFPQAVDVFETLSRDASHGTFHEQSVYWLAESYFKSGDYLNAVKYYSEIISNYPT